MQFQTVAEKIQSYFSRRKHIKLQSQLGSHDREQKPEYIWSVVLTRQHGDADGATLPEHLDRGMLDHARVPPLIRWAHLHQYYLRRRQHPITPLNEKKRQQQCEIHKIQAQIQGWLIATENCQNLLNSKNTSWVVRSEKPAALHGSIAKVLPLTYVTHRSFTVFRIIAFTKKPLKNYFSEI